MGIKKCLKCRGFVNRYLPKVGTWMMYKAAYHWVTILGEGKRIGHCLHRHDAKTACGKKFVEDVDSSD